MRMERQGVMAAEVDKLTEAEREVLRLWARRASAKEIALELGITHWAVNERLRSARRRLGVADSNEAARLLAEAEAGGAYNRIVYEPSAIAPAAPIEPSQPRERQQATTAGSAVREVQAEYTVAPFAYRLGFRLPFPTHGETRNELTASERLAWIGGAALCIIIAVGTLVTIGEGLARPVVSIVRALS